MEQEFDVKIYLNALKRRYVSLIALSAGVFALVCIVTYLLPVLYRAEAKILVESQQIPSDLAQATVTAKAVERIQIIQQRLMTRNNLLSVAREFKLFPKDRDNLSPSEIVDEMRSSAQIEPIVVSSSNRRNAPTIAFTVSFEYRTPVVAARVANKFVELILEQNIRSRTKRATETRKFFDRQLRSHELSLTNLEERIVKFKNENRNALPDSLNYRRGLLPRLRSDIFEINRKLNALAEEKKLLEARMRNGSVAAAADPNASLSDKELERLRTVLIQMRGLYSDSHPAVRKVKAQIEALENASQESVPSEGKTAKRIPINDAANKESVVKSRIPDYLSLLERRKNTLQKNRTALERRIVSINATIARTPEVEIQLQSLINEHDNLQALHRQVKVKMSLATVGERLEEGRQAERFEVIEQATPPREPIKPKRIQILIAGSFVSFASGIGLVVLLEMLDKSIRGSAALEGRLQIRPISIIPYVKTVSERRSRKRKIIISLLLVIVLITAALIAIDRFYLPLDLILQKILQHIKLLGV